MADSLAIRPKETLSSPSSHRSADSQFQKVTLWYTLKSVKEVAEIINSVDQRACVGEFSFSTQEPNNVPVVRILPWPFLKKPKSLIRVVHLPISLRDSTRLRLTHSPWC